MPLSNQTKVAFNSTYLRILARLSFIARPLIYYTGILKILAIFRKYFLKKHRTIIVCYHHIGHFSDRNSKNGKFTVSKEDFEKHIKYLATHFTVISLSELIENSKGLKKAERDQVVITFDDGYEDNFLEAVPILEKYAAPATFFVYLKQIGEAGYLSLEQMRAMKDRGFEFGSHTLTHPHLTDISENDAAHEICFSRQLLEDQLKVKIRYFAYPYGDFNARIVQMVRDASYEGAVTVHDGDCSSSVDMFTLNRKMIEPHPFSFFVVHVTGLFENTRFSII